MLWARNSKISNTNSLLETVGVFNIYVHPTQLNFSRIFHVMFVSCVVKNKSFYETVCNFCNGRKCIQFEVKSSCFIKNSPTERKVVP